MAYRIHHREGTCAYPGPGRPNAGAFQLPTKCGHVIVLPWGIDTGTVSCQGCKQDGDEA